MVIYLSLRDTEIMTAVRQYLLAILPSGIEVVQGNTNRVPMPRVPNFVCMESLRRTQLSTSVSSIRDIRFVASIAATTMTVTEVTEGTLTPGLGIRNGFTQPNTTIVSQTSGTTGGAGIYVVSPTQTVASGVMSGGTRTILQPTQYDMQVDVYGPAAADNAQIVQTLFRDPMAVEYLAGYNIPILDQLGDPLLDQFGQILTALVKLPVAPLYASETRHLSFVNAEHQYEGRWGIDLSLQINPEITVPQDYADQIIINSQLVDAADDLAVSTISVETL